MNKELFYKKLYSSLVKTQLRRGQSQETAEDLAQQAILQVLNDIDRHPKNYPDEESIRRVAHTTARNLLATLANRDTMMKRRHVRIKNDELFSTASNDSAEKEYLKRRDSRRINRALEEIPADSRTFLERIADGESITDIAKSLLMPRGTAGKKISEARKKTQRWLKGNE